MNTIYSWNFSTEKERSHYWYLIAFSIVIWLAIWWVLSKIYIFSFLVLLMSWVYIYLENSTEDEVNVEIVDDGIKINWNKYLFTDILSFWIINSEDKKPVLLRLFLNTKGIKTLDLDIDENIYSDINPILSEVLEKREDIKLTTMEKIIKFINL